MKIKKITTVGMLCALAMIINILVSFPIVPAVSFLKYDPKDIVIVIGGFIYGPMTAFIMSFICSIFEIFIRGGNIIDIIMNVISTCAFACVAAYIYKRKRSKKWAIIGLILGIVVNIVSMLIWNYIVTPIYYGMPRSAVVALLLPGILPFNLIKCTLNATCAYLLYKPLVKILRNTNLVEKSDYKSILNKGSILVGITIIVTLILFILGYQEII